MIPAIGNMENTGGQKKYLSILEESINQHLFFLAFDLYGRQLLGREIAG
jgi:hypothetical protein